MISFSLVWGNSKYRDWWRILSKSFHLAQGTTTCNWETNQAQSTVSNSSLRAEKGWLGLYPQQLTMSVLDLSQSYLSSYDFIVQLIMAWWELANDETKFNL